MLSSPNRTSYIWRGNVYLRLWAGILNLTLWRCLLSIDPLLNASLSPLSSWGIGSSLWGSAFFLEEQYPILSISQWEINKVSQWSQRSRNRDCDACSHFRVSFYVNHLFFPLGVTDNGSKIKLRSACRIIGIRGFIDQTKDFAINPCYPRGGFWVYFMWRHTVRGQRSSRLFTELKTWFERAVFHARWVCLQLCLDKFLRWSIIEKKTAIPQLSSAFSLNRSKEIVNHFMLCQLWFTDGFSYV